MPHPRPFKPIQTMIFKKVDALTQGKEMTIEEFREHCNLTTSPADNLLQRLTKHGFLTRGSKRGRYARTRKLDTKIELLRREDDEAFVERHGDAEI